LYGHDIDKGALRTVSGTGNQGKNGRGEVMIKVLLADDEKKVCQLITHLVDWKELGFEIVGIVNDGESAYRFIQEHPVDVMITDIRMPECDGMELIEKAKAVYPEIHFVIISGYSQFDYAQNAIRYGVEDYLLKPIRKKDLTATLKKISDKYTAEMKVEEKWEHIQKSLKENEEKVRGSLLHNLLARPEEFAGLLAREKINREYHCDFVDDIYQTVILKPVLTAQEPETRRMLLKKVMGIMDQLMDGVCHEKVYADMNEDVYCIFNGSAEEIERVYKKLKRVRLDIIRLQDVFEQVTVYIALGDVKEEFSTVWESFESAGRAMNDRFYYNDQVFLTAREKKSTQEILGRIINNTFKKRFLNYIEIMDLESISAELDKIKKMLIESEEKDGSLVAKVYEEIITLFYLGIHNYNISIPNQYTELLAKLQKIGTIEEAVHILKNYMIQALEGWYREKKYVESKPIRMAKKYIADHYYLPLTLEMVSGEIGFNASYFSSLFKKETGMNFSEYLIKVRIDNAKNLLLNTGDQVVDISEAVGYSDIKHFSKLFKKVTGLTPTEFRKLYN